MKEISDLSTYDGLKDMYRVKVGCIPEYVKGPALLFKYELTTNELEAYLFPTYELAEEEAKLCNGCFYKVKKEQLIAEKKRFLQLLTPL